MLRPIEMRDDASVAEVRERVREVGATCGLDRKGIERVALAASELAYNVLKHGIDGEVSVACITRGSDRGIEITSRDVGPGMSDLTAAVRGRAQTDGLGMGVGIIRRQTDELDVDTRTGEGTRIAARKWEGKTDPHLEYGIVGRPHPGERHSGDDAVVVRFDHSLLAAVIDGLGHGELAHEAAGRAVQTIRDHATTPLDSLVARLDQDLRGTRGIAVSLARLNERARTIQMVGVGNVGMRVHYRGWNDVYVPRSGVLGTPSPHRSPRIREHDFPIGSTLLMHTDGIATHPGFEARELILPEHPVVAADHLIRTQSKTTDDALVLVIR